MLLTIVRRVAGLIAAVFLPLAAGAVWSALSLRFSAELPGMALLCAAAIWPARHHLPGPPGLVRGVLGAASCATGIAYAHWLKSATVIAQAIGVGFGDALMSIGAGLTIAISRARSDPTSITFIAIALMLSFWMGCRRDATDVMADELPSVN